MKASVFFVAMVLACLYVLFPQSPDCVGFATEPPPADGDVAARDHWAFRKLTQPKIPTLRDPSVVSTPIDAFILARLEENGVSFSPLASRHTLARRAYLDLHGLPPTLAEIDAFLSDTQPGSFQRLIDQLLKSRHYGERWGRHWLDVAGYADTVSIDNDLVEINTNENIWRYRDWVIQAMNRGMRYDQFLTEQLAGDELVDWRNAKEFTPETIDHLVATGYMRQVIDKTDLPQYGLKERYEVLRDLLETVSSSIMGLTIKCAQCHDHEYEPITQAEYYSMMGLFMPAYNPSDWTIRKERHLRTVSPQRLAEIAAIDQGIRDDETAIAELREPAVRQLTERKISILLAHRDPRGPTVAGTPPEPPRLPVTANLALWLDAHDLEGSATTTDRVRRWPDKTAEKSDVFQDTPARQPTYLANGLNGKPALQFDGKDDVLVNPDANVLTNLSAYTWFVVAKTNVTNDNDFALSFGTDNSFGRLEFFNDAIYLTAGQNTSYGHTRSFSSKEFHVFSHTFDGSQAEDTHKLQCWIDGQRQPVSSFVDQQPARTPNERGFTLGAISPRAEPGSPVHFDGQVAEILVYRRRLTMSERLYVGSYLQSKWGLKSHPLPDAVARARQTPAEKRTDLQKYLAPLLKRDNVDVRFAAQQLYDDSRQSIRLPGPQRNTIQQFLANQIGPLMEIPEDELDGVLPVTSQQQISQLKHSVDKLRQRKQAIKPGELIQALWDTGAPPPTHILERGRFDQAAQAVVPGFPKALCLTTKDAQRARRPADAAGKTSGYRLALARWLTHPQTPAGGLTARVFVNRIWFHHFGRGLVKRLDNFGLSGEAPSHPELLEWLAAKFVQSDWDIKALHKLVMTSNVYRQSSHRTTLSEAERSDPGNTLYWQQNLPRLEAEVIRDSILLVSGQLDRTTGGPPIALKSTPNGMSTTGQPRRSIYVFARRNYPLKILETFDTAIAPVNTTQRMNTTSVLQSLTLLNSPLIVESARKTAAQLVVPTERSHAGQVERAYLQILARQPSPVEQQTCNAFLESQATSYRDQSLSPDQASHQALADLCQMLMCSNDFLHRP